MRCHAPAGLIKSKGFITPGSAGGYLYMALSEPENSCKKGSSRIHNKALSDPLEISI